MSKNNAAKLILQYREKATENQHQTPQNVSSSKCHSSTQVRSVPSQKSGQANTVNSNHPDTTACCTGSEPSQTISPDSPQSNASAVDGTDGVSVELTEISALTSKNPSETEQTRECSQYSVQSLKQSMWMWFADLRDKCVARCSCCETCCASTIVSGVNLTSTLSMSRTAARLAGAMIGLAIVFTADCWLEHPPFIGDVLGVMGSFGATIVLNSIEWDVIITSKPEVHQQVVIALLVCYGVIFFQGGVVIWHLVQAPAHRSHWEDKCHEACCAAVEGYYCLLVLSGCSLLRFAVPLEGMQNASYNSLVTSAAAGSGGANLSKGGSIGATVGAALLLVVGALLQMFGTFGKLGTGTAVFVPMPVVMLMPVILITRVKSAQAGQRFGVWTGWECFVPSLLYVFSSFWPFALFHREYLDSVQLALCSSAVVCFLLAARFLVLIVESKADGSGHRMQWQF